MGAVKEKKLKNNVDMAVEREMRQIEEKEGREREPGELEQLRPKWEQSAQRAEKKLPEIWNDKPETGSDKRPQLGYFSGVTIENGKVIR
jgi:hypothetical protein